MSTEPPASGRRGGIARRLAVALSLLLTIFAGAAALAFAGLHELHEALHAVEDDVARMRSALNLATAVRDQYAHMAHTIILADDSHSEMYEEAAGRVQRTAGEIARHSLEPTAASALSEIRRASGELDEIYRKKLLPAVRTPGLGSPAALHPHILATVDGAQAAAERLSEASEDDKVIAPRYEEAAASPKPWFTRGVRVGSGWQRHILLFDDFQQIGRDGSSTTTKLDTSAVWSVHFIAGLTRRTGAVWVDDLALLCRGSCVVPPHDLPTTSTATGLRDDDLMWTPSSSSESDLRCAELASLSITPADQWIAGPGQRVFLRARVSANPAAAVPLWGWTVEKLPQGPLLPVTTLDPGDSLISVVVPEPGQYRIRAHTHYPGMTACGAELIATANAR